MRIAIHTLLRVRTRDCFPTPEHLAGENSTIALEKKGRLKGSLQSSDAIGFIGIAWTESTRQGFCIISIVILWGDFGSAKA